MTPNMNETRAWLRANGFLFTAYTAKQKTEISRAFDAGNYGNAYEGTDLESALKRARYTAPHTRAAFVLGFFGSYERDEMGWDEREIYDEAYWSPAGRYVVKVARYTDSRDEEYASECDVATPSLPQPQNTEGV